MEQRKNPSARSTLHRECFRIIKIRSEYFLQECLHHTVCWSLHPNWRSVWGVSSESGEIQQSWLGWRPAQPDNWEEKSRVFSLHWHLKPTGEPVSPLSPLLSVFIAPLQVYLVVGGETTGSNYLDSAEILVEGTYAWTAVSSLPQKFWKMRLVSLNNIPYMFG